MFSLCELSVFVSNTEILPRELGHVIQCQKVRGQSQITTSLGKGGKRCGFNFVGCALLRFSSLEFIIKSDYGDQGKKPRPKFGVAEMLNLRGFRFGSEDRKWSAVDNIHIVESSTRRVILYYAEDYIKKGMPKVFRRCEIVGNILRLRVRVTKSLCE